MADQDQDLIDKVKAYVEVYMNNFDASHDFQHILRVVGLAHLLASKMPSTSPALDRTTITLAALLHDVGDRKYLKSDQDQEGLILHLLLSLGASPTLAQKIQTICLAVSWTSELKNPSYVLSLITQYPELAVVQDADRLDAIGAIGIGRVFTYGGAKTTRGLEESIGMMDGKLMEIEGRMKTEPGREMARERTERLRVFRGWWGEEVGSGGSGKEVLGLGEGDGGGEVAREDLS